MKVKFLIIFLLFLTGPSQSQVFSIRPGKMYYHSKTITPVIGQYKSGNITDYFSFHFDYFVYKRKLSLGVSFSRFEGWTEFSVKADPGFGFGSSSTIIYRYAAKVGFNIFHKKRKFSLSPEFRIIFEQAKSTWWYSQRAYVTNEVSPYYEGPIFLDPLNSFQILPALGIDLDWNFWWRLHFVYSTYYAWGHKPFQKYYFEYTYDGVPQPTGEWHSDGTGWFFSVGMGMTIFQYKKEKTERALRRKKRKN